MRCALHVLPHHHCFKQVGATNRCLIVHLAVILANTVGPALLEARSEPRKFESGEILVVDFGLRFLSPVSLFKKLVWPRRDTVWSMYPTKNEVISFSGNARRKKFNVRTTRLFALT